MSANGRVNILEPVTSNVFNLYDRVPIDQKATSFRNALTGNFESNQLSKSFFCAKNIIALQNALIEGVYKNSNGRYHIGYQDEDTLKIIMRSIYLQHSANQPDNIKQQIHALNKLVLDYSIPQLCGECDAYIKYKNDVSTLAVPLQRPVSTYSNNVLETTNFF